MCFLCVLCFLPYQVGAQTQPQKKITIEFSNERLPSVLKRLEKISGYKILFTYDDVKKFTVSGSVKDKSLEQTLDVILSNKPLEYHIEDQFVTITPKGPSKQAKVFNVKGVVISGDDNQPLIGATVLIKGSKSGVLTDMDGKFSIENVSNKSVLQFSYIGMKPQDLTPAPSMSVTLMPDVQTLSEVVVTGMQKMDKRLFTGATNQLTAENVNWTAFLISAVDWRTRSRCISTECIGNFRNCAKNPCPWSNFHLWQFKAIMGGRWSNHGRCY